MVIEILASLPPLPIQLALIIEIEGFQVILPNKILTKFIFQNKLKLF